jgi:FkbM family methyltransferase
MNNNIINERPFLQWGLKHEIGSSNDGEDDFVISYFKDKKINRKRLVVDIGAADGLTGSNSKKLINEHNWCGILIEPFLPFYNYLTKLYCDNDNVTILNYACDIDEKDTVIYYQDNHDKVGLTSLLPETAINQNLNQKQIIKTKKFNDLVKTQYIDFISIDTEGKDFDILKDIDFKKYTIEIICCERWVGHDIDYNNIVIQFLSEKNFKLVKTTNSNLIFLNNDIRI